MKVALADELETNAHPRERFTVGYRPAPQTTGS